VPVTVLEKERHIAQKYKNMEEVLDERSRRRWGAVESKALGRGGPSIVSRATGIGRTTIYVGIAELAEPVAHATRRIRTTGGGRKPIQETQPEIESALNALLEPTERGDPESTLRWTTKSLARLAKVLHEQKHQISTVTIRKLLKQQKYSLQSNRKRREGTDHPDRDLQFHFITESVQEQQKKDQPCISIDTKKKENIGRYKNNGQEWSKKGKPVEVNMHDFPDKELGKAVPYGVYDLIEGSGWVNIGIDHDTAQFAVESMRRWWIHMGSARYANATELLITADCGGSNSSRSRLWKIELQKFANETHLMITVRHFPPGTSKWNKIEHRLFSMITKNWRGRPLDSLATIVNLIGNTKTKTGLTVRAMVDRNTYAKGIKVSDAELNAVNLTRAVFHGEWNYSISPQCE
jgi:hypothetical protein